MLGMGDSDLCPDCRAVDGEHIYDKEPRGSNLPSLPFMPGCWAHQGFGLLVLCSKVFLIFVRMFGETYIFIGMGLQA